MNAQERLAEAELLLEARNLPPARAAFADAQRCGADPNHCAGSLWLTDMLAGDFETAWRQSDALRQRSAPDPHRFWNGKEIQGKRVIVRCLHGFGDAVQMLRYAPQLMRLAAHVTFEVPPRLVTLAGCLAGVDHVVTWGEQAPANPPKWDIQVEIMELPYLFRTTLADLPVAERYLQLSPALLRKADIEMGGRTKPRIGVVCSSGTWNPARDLPVHLVEPMLEQHPELEFWSLEINPEAICTLRHQPSITGEGILPLAATIMNLDLVITVDTLAAHLAGALGRPAWLLLRYAADWRWLHLRTDSPWYPTIELFRQSAPGDWRSVVDCIHQRLGSLQR